MHKSQGFGSIGRRGMQLDYLELMAGSDVESDPFEGIEMTWARVEGGDQVGEMIHGIIEEFQMESPDVHLSALLECDELLATLGNDPWIRVKRAELQRVVKGCAGLWFEAISEQPSVVAGDAVRIQLAALNRSDIGFELEQISIPALGWSVGDSLHSLGVELPYNEVFAVDTSLTIPANFAADSRPDR